MRPYFISYLHSPRTFLRPNTVSPLPLPRPRSYRYLGERGVSQIACGRKSAPRAIFRRFYPMLALYFLVTDSLSRKFFFICVSGLTQIRASRCLRSADGGACRPFAVPRLPSARKIYRRVGGRHCLLWLDQRQTVAPSISRTFYTYSHTRPFFPFFFFLFSTTHI